MFIFFVFYLLVAKGSGSKELQMNVKIHPNLWSSSNGQSATIVGLLYYTNALGKPVTQEVSLTKQFVQDETTVFDEMLNENLKEVQGFHIFATQSPAPVQIDNILFKNGNKEYIVAVRQFVGGTGRTTSLRYMNAIPKYANPDADKDYMYILSMHVGNTKFDDAIFLNTMLYANVIGDHWATEPYQLTHWKSHFVLNQNYSFIFYGPHVGQVKAIQLYLAPYWIVSESKWSYEQLTPYLAWKELTLSVFLVSKGQIGYYQKTQRGSVGNGPFNYYNTIDFTTSVYFRNIDFDLYKEEMINSKKLMNAELLKGHFLNELVNVVDVDKEDSKSSINLLLQFFSDDFCVDKEDDCAKIGKPQCTNQRTGNLDNHGMLLTKSKTRSGEPCQRWNASPTVFQDDYSWDHNYCRVVTKLPHVYPSDGPICMPANRSAGNNWEYCYVQCEVVDKKELPGSTDYCVQQETDSSFCAKTGTEACGSLPSAIVDSRPARELNSSHPHPGFCIL